MSRAPIPPGLDLSRLASWLAEHVPEVGGELRAQLLAGGRSNLTFAVTDGRSEWVLRRPPLGHVLTTAHDMAREYRVLSALQGAAVPVPRTLALCQDPSVLGCDFYVMERVAGRTYRTADQLAPLGPDRIRALAEELVRTLVALHRVQPELVGLEDFGRPQGFLARQVRRWRQQLERSLSRDLPPAEELYVGLLARVPAESGATVVHGDYRMDNLLYDAHDRAVAVLDWEMATLGDPLTDVALMVTYDRLSTLTAGGPVPDFARAPGYPTEAELLDRYAQRSGRDLSDLGFHLGLAAFKVAVILENIHYRHHAGQTVGAGFDGVGDAVVPLLQAGLLALREHR